MFAQDYHFFISDRIVVTDHDHVEDDLFLEYVVPTKKV